MINTRELFKGVAVVIDDQINSDEIRINNLIKQLHNNNVPTLEYDSLPDENIDSFSGISFMILDWNLIRSSSNNESGLSSSDILEGVDTNQKTLEKDNMKNNVDFIHKVNEIIFCPIFIFTNENENEIYNILIENNLYIDDKPNNIFVFSKKDLIIPKELSKNNYNDLISSLAKTDSNVFKSYYHMNEEESKYLLQKDDYFDESKLLSLINKSEYCHLWTILNLWLEKSPSVYVLKEWEKLYQNCKTRLFCDFYKLDTNWTSIMWSNFNNDRANKSSEMGNLILRNLLSRMSPFEFNEEILNNNVSVSKEELRKILEGERFLKKDTLQVDDICTGDLFIEQYSEKEVTKKRYLLNIRAKCDLLGDENPELYLISGYELKQKSNGKIDNVSFSKGQYLEKIHHSIVAFVDNGKIIEFKYNEFKIENWEKFKEYRIGRLLPPYIDRIQQRFALYMHRQGLPRIPESAIK